METSFCPNFLFLNKREIDVCVVFTAWCDMAYQITHFAKTLKNANIDAILNISKYEHDSGRGYYSEVTVDTREFSFEHTLSEIKESFKDNEYLVIGTSFSQTEWFGKMIRSIGDELNIQPL